MEKLLKCSVFVMLLCFLVGCATKKQIEYVDREVVKYVTKVHHDTLINNVHDSIYHTIFQKGDTIYDTKYVYHTKYRDKIVAKTDTCWRDSVVVQNKNKVKEVTKIPKIFWASLFFSIIFCIFVIIKFVRWLQIH